MPFTKGHPFYPAKKPRVWRGPPKKSSLDKREWPVTPKEILDAEPVPKKRERIRGDKCWYVDNGRWFLMNVLRPDPMNLILTSATGWDAERQKEWPVTVEFRIRVDGALSKRLRPLKDRKP